MKSQFFEYIIAGAGLAGVSAVQAIREQDPLGSILLVGAENRLPYNRPPLTKGLWSGKKKFEDIFVQSSVWFEKNGVELRLGTAISAVSPVTREVFLQEGGALSYGKLLLSTGGSPRRLSLPGEEDEFIFYYRYVSDYERLRPLVKPGVRVAVIGGGFIGSELAASLSLQGAQVTIIMPQQYLCSRVFPDELARAVTGEYTNRGIYIMAHDSVQSFHREGEQIVIETGSGLLRSDLVVAGLGIEPETELAGQAGLRVEKGIWVDEYLRTSDPDIYAAGDNAFFPYQALQKRVRVEHWDNAMYQGYTAGRNMAGGEEVYSHMPYFFSDLFDFGYEAVGDVNSANSTVSDWREQNVEGVIYYLNGLNQIVGVMCCGIYGKMDQARDVIRRRVTLDPAAKEFPISGD